ncbi:uncharacterized protein OCT59_002560 [Rhizophagus irregularis]|uniref:uncharacterized protein n=1 Tax=Rhizophagus irregularis TaxID=588596 RepID=UPI000CB32C02|nr:hypothetical protein OCT59_002560 [Rhizophagus irregularis]GBC13588.1 hypothetical protein RIR_jg8707.t1 [Rhizophagus irregularis DAOM 181602=DAOM 197198]
MQHFPQFPTIFQENGEFAFFEFWTMAPLRPVMDIGGGTEAGGSFAKWCKKGKVIEQHRRKIELEFRNR